MGKGLSYLKNWGMWVNDCWNYGSSKFLLQFIEYRLDQLNNKHQKIAVNSAIQYFKDCSQRKCLLKVWSFLVHLSRISDIWFNKNAQYVQNLICQWHIQSVCEKGWFTINEPSKMLLFTFCRFPLPKFLKAIVKNLIMDFEGSW